MSYSRHYPPALKSTVDLQLQTAFDDGNWQSAIRLADRRAKSTKDPYYDAIKICAESQLDNSAEKYAVVFAVSDLVNKGTAAKLDLDTIDLYEWACRDLMREMDYAETFGVLRLRYVKANPKATANGISCLQGCLLHWDLVNGQQIAAILDKASANSNDRRPMFWNITLTYLLSTSPQCPDGKQKLYGLLASKQLERAADTSEKAQGDDLTDRGLRTEEELSLFYHVLKQTGTKDDYLKRIMHPELGAMKQFEQGKKQLFLEALDVFQSLDKVDEIYDFCQQALSVQEDEDVPSYLAADWKVWQMFIKAASKKADDQAAFEELQQLLQTFVSTKAKVTQMYKRNIALALLETNFRMPKSLLPETVGPEGLSPRVAQVCLFLDQNFDRLSCFDDLKGYITEMSFGEVKYFIEVMIPKLVGDNATTWKRFALKVLELKFRYLLTTCPQTLSELPSVANGEPQPSTYRCRVCSQSGTSPCETCLKNIVSEASSTREEINADFEFVGTITKLDKDPRLDLSMVIGLSLLKLAGLSGQTTKPAQPPLQDVDVALFLQAVLVLDSQLQETPNDNGLRLLLVKLYLLLGCVSYAYKLWTPLDVKRTIQDSLSPHFFDRISTLSPSLFLNNKFFTPLWSYYTNTLRDPCPIRIWDAFSSGSYSSILDMAEYDDRLRRSCTVVMSVVEERQAALKFKGRLEDSVHENALVANIAPDTDLVDSTDYGTFANLESKFVPPIQDLVKLGPAFSPARSHLALLTAQLVDVVTYKYPKDYKPSKQQDIAQKDYLYNVEVLSRVHNSATSILHDPSTPAHLTAAEHALYMTTVLLSGILSTALTLARSSQPLPAHVIDTITALKTTLNTLRESFLSGPAANQPELFSQLTDMHTLSCLRDLAVAIKQSVIFLQTWHEGEMVRDRSGKSGCHKDIISAMKALDGLATKTLADVKGRIMTMKSKLGEGGWLDRVVEWTFGANNGKQDDIVKAVQNVVGGRSGAENWVGKLLESWNEGVTGWTLVKME